MLTKIAKSIIFITFVSTTEFVKSDPEFRIIGGNNADEGQFPFVVSLRTAHSGSHFCGGTLIEKNWVLTAAACIYGQNNNLIVVAGTNYLNSGGLKLSVVKNIYHERYNPQNNANNVALLKLNVDQLTDDSKSIQIIEMEDKFIEGSRDCIAVGWGLTQYPSQQLSNNLQFLNTKTIDMERCLAALPGYPISSLADICMFTKVGEGQCQGDMGGPLVIEEEDKFKLIAINGWGIPCAKGAPDINVRISYYYDWIQNITQNN